MVNLHQLAPDVYYKNILLQMCCKCSPVLILLFANLQNLFYQNLIAVPIVKFTVYTSRNNNRIISTISPNVTSCTTICSWTNFIYFYFTHNLPIEIYTLLLLYQIHQLSTSTKLIHLDLAGIHHHLDQC